MELEREICTYYRVKRKQRLADIANAFRVPPRVLAAENGLTEEPEEGRVLRIPAERHDLYTVRGGESKALLCGSDETFEARNKTRHLYIGQIVWL